MAKPGFDFNKGAMQVIDRLINIERDTKRIKDYNTFWKKRNNKAIEESLNPSLSQEALNTMPYITNNPQFTAKKQQSTESLLTASFFAGASTFKDNEQSILECERSLKPSKFLEIPDETKVNLNNSASD